MLYGKYSFTVTFNSDAILPPYKGSTFRGVFGHALKRVTCALKRQSCDDCMLRSKCVYPFVFETVPHEKADRRIAAPATSSLLIRSSVSNETGIQTPRKE